MSGGAMNLLSGALIAAVITAGVTVWLAHQRSLAEQRERVRTTLAEGFQAYAEYKEFPYAVRRRRSDEPAAERVRLSEAIRAAQARLSFHLVWTAAESPSLGSQYTALVDELRKVAGRAIQDAWLAQPITDDAGMNIPPGTIDLSSLKPFEAAYLEEVHAYLHPQPRTRPRDRGSDSGSG